MSDTTLAWTGRAGPFSLHIAPGVFAPSTISKELAEALVIRDGDIVIDLGSGCGLLAFVAAKLGAKKVYATDLNPQAIACGRANAERLGLSDIVEFRQTSLFDELQGIEADVVIGDVSGIPDEFARVSGWFPGGFAGGPTGAELPIAMLDRALQFLRTTGRFYLPTGSIQDEGSILRKARTVFGGDDRVQMMRERLVPMPAKLAETPEVKSLMEKGIVTVSQRGSRLIWDIRIWECTLAPA